MSLWVLSLVAVCVLLACSFRVGQLPGGGGFVQFTIAGKTFTIMFGNAGVFEVVAGEGVVKGGVRVDNLFEGQTPTDQPATGQVTLDAASVTVTPLDVNKAIAPLQPITGSFEVVVYIGDVSSENPCTEGTRVGTFDVAVSAGSVSMGETALGLPSAALAEVITGSFTLCMEVSGNVDARLAIGGMDIVFGESATATASFTFRNDDIENIHFLLPGETFEPSNRVSPSQSWTVALPGVAIGDTVTIQAGRNGVVLDSTSCPTVTGTNYSATVVWDGSSVTCEAEQSDGGGDGEIIQVPLDGNGDAVEPTATVNGVDYSYRGALLEDNSEDAPIPGLLLWIDLDLAALGLEYVETIYLAPQSSWSYDLPDGVTVATVTCDYAEGGSPTTLDLVMGTNIAEWAWENPCLAEAYGAMPPHAMPTPLFTSPTMQDCDREYDGHSYGATIRPDTSRTLSMISLELVDPGPLVASRFPDNYEPTWLGAAIMAITLEGPAGTPDIGPMQDECTFDWECDVGERCEDGECVPEEDEGGSFEITSVSWPSSVESGGDRGDLTVYWSGDPVFPVEIVYRLAGVCPSGFTCETPTMTFSDETSPLVFPDAVYCYGATTDVFFDYEVVMIDDRGVESDPYPASFTCAVDGLFTNGSFEEGPLSVGAYLPLNPGDTSITGWVVTRGQIDYVGTEWTAASGVRAIDLDGTPGPGGIAQTFQTTAGQAYTVTFAFSGNPICGDAVKQMRVEAAGATQDYSFDTTGDAVPDIDWVTESFSFVATGATTTLEFYSLSSSGSACGPAIDNVVLSSP
ncbi:MAG: choice-of-anchor C family protein [Phycisphaerales bacterium]|nr:MAG: choice-of-anchor C family protein [Phycisphaerales bacterium]